MRTRLIPTWIVVTDASRAEFFALGEADGVRNMEMAAPVMVSHLEHHSSDLKSDKPGRSFASVGGGVRHAVEPHHDYHKLEKHDFAASVMAFLEKSFDAHAFERLVFVAPSRTIGELRALLPHKMKASVWHEIPHDYLKLGAGEIWARIAPELKEHVQPGT
jgi:protein required for attachment to host cells